MFYFEQPSPEIFGTPRFGNPALSSIPIGCDTSEHYHYYYDGDDDEVYSSSLVRTRLQDSKQRQETWFDDGPLNLAF